MEHLKLNKYILDDKKEDVSKISQYLKKEVLTVSEMLKLVKNSQQKDKKLLEVSKDLSKIMDLYDEDNKININRDVFLKEFISEISPFIPKGNEADYTLVIDLILNETVEYDVKNWNKVYDNIKEAVNAENREIDKNALYSVNYEDLVPKHLIETLKKENNELIDGGRFSFESCTQEMIGIINEFVLLKGSVATNMYLNQGVKDEIKIKELLKEVNAASLLEPFTFHKGQPRFEKAKSGQFDGFILHRDNAKILLATKDENTTIEGDSVFRHFVTGMLIKKKIDQAELNQSMVNKKINNWIDHYTNQERLNTNVRKLKYERRREKSITSKSLTLNDYYVDKGLVLEMNKKIEDAQNRGLKFVSVSLDSPDYLVDSATATNLLNRDLMKTSTLKLSLEDALKKRTLLSSIVKKQEELKEMMSHEGYRKVVENPKFLDQIEIDVKKAEMVKNSDFLSMREMISYYNKNTREALEELGVLDSSKKDLNFESRTLFLESLENGEADKFKVPELNAEHVSKMLNMARNELNVELVYYGSVSGKKQAKEYHYNEEEKIKNKEFRYGLNMLAYANILSDSVKDKFIVSSDAALEFVDFIKLRTVTKKTSSGYDVDLEKMNKNSFIQDIIHYTCKDIYETNKITDDSVDFYENLFNASNVLLADFIEDVEAEKDYAKENGIELDYKDIYTRSMEYKTGRREEKYDLEKTLRTLKEMSITKSHKFIHGNSIIETVNNKIEKIIEDSKDPDLKQLLEEYAPKRSATSKEKRRSRLRR